MTRTICAAALLVIFCLLGNGFAIAHSGPHQDGWVDVGGNVTFGSTPVCALVLINGQTKFSCDGTGRYDMQVPIDDKGMITVMVFADGFAPFNQIVTPEEASAYPIDMLRDQDSASFQVETTYEPSATDGWIVASGTINSGNTPVCALALANGQSMFSCAENLGQFSLNVPPDQDGNITLMVFADGFKPLKVVAEADPDTDGDGLRNSLDEDDDNDGILDVDDALPLCLVTGALVPSCIVMADGKEWAQPVLFRNLSWNQINAVCFGGPCVAGGILNGHDMTGWTWASATELLTLFEFYGFKAPSPELAAEWNLASGQLITENGNAALWPAPGWLPTFIGCPFECVYSYEGYTRDSFNVGGDAPLSGRVGLVSYADPVVAQSYTWTANPRAQDYRPPTIGAEEIGGWFYRSP
jgi:hypothetical protein